jgi:hypothetical protein
MSHYQCDVCDADVQSSLTLFSMRLCRVCSQIMADYSHASLSLQLDGACSRKDHKEAERLALLIAHRDRLYSKRS